MGARAMQNASRHGGNRLFEQISERLVEQADGIEVKAVQHGSSSVPPPRDTELVTGLARGIDDYYGTVDAGADLQLFWHAASSLSHAERWYRALAASDAGRAFAQTLEERSFDAVCSGINVLGQTILGIQYGLPRAVDLATS